MYALRPILSCLAKDIQMVDTAGTLCKAATTVKEHGANEVLAICTHGILSGKAIDNLNACDALSKLVVTNARPLSDLTHYLC